MLTKKSDVHLKAGELFPRFIRWASHGYYLGPITVVVDDGSGGSLCRDAPPCEDCGGTLSNLGPSLRLGLLREPGDRG